MDRLDKDILKELQNGFPVCPHPFDMLAEKLGINEEDMRTRIGQMKREGIIKRIGASFDYKKLGYESTLIAMSVPEDALEKTASIINGYPGVTHNYARNNKYNLWFTLMASSKDNLENILGEIKEKTGIRDILNLPVKRFFKLNVQFNFD